MKYYVEVNIEEEGWIRLKILTIDFEADSISTAWSAVALFFPGAYYGENVRIISEKGEVVTTEEVLKIDIL